MAKNVYDASKDVRNALKKTMEKIYGSPSLRGPGLFNIVLDIVDKKWNPKRVPERDETGYKNDLWELLKKERGKESDTEITSMDSRRGCDLLIAKGEEKVAIELKKDLEMGDVRRSKSQFEEFVKEYSGLIVVLLGKTAPNAYEDVRGKIIQLRKLYPQKPIKLLEKPF